MRKQSPERFSNLLGSHRNQLDPDPKPRCLYSCSVLRWPLTLSPSKLHHMSRLAQISTHFEFLSSEALESSWALVCRRPRAAVRPPVLLLPPGVPSPSSALSAPGPRPRASFCRPWAFVSAWCCRGWHYGEASEKPKAKTFRRCSCLGWCRCSCRLQLAAR